MDGSPDASASIPTVQVTRIAHNEPIMEEAEEEVQSVIEGEPCVTAELLMPPPSTIPSKSEVCENLFLYIAILQKYK